MANPYIGWVNLQLVSVRHHLSLLLEESNANERLRNRGVLESSTWHLNRAYQYYLYELGANYQLKEPESNKSAIELGEALEAIDKHPGEAAELAQLEKDGWIADLKRALVDLDRPDSTPGAKLISQQAMASQAHLKLVNLEDEPIPLSAERLRNWLEKFKELTTRHREVMVEY